MKKERAAPASGAAGIDPRHVEDSLSPSGGSWIILQPLSPSRTHASWRAEERVLAAIGGRLGAPAGKIEVRIHALAPGSVDARAPLTTIPVRLDAASTSSMIELPAPGMRIVAELCAAAPGPTAVLARSNIVELPSEREPPGEPERTARVRGSARGDLWKARTADAPTRVSGEAPGTPLPGEPPRVEPAPEPKPGAAARVRRHERVAGEAPIGLQPESPPPAGVEPSAPAELAGAYEETASLEMRFTAAALPETSSSADIPVTTTMKPYLSIHMDLVVHGRAEPGTEVVIDGVVVPVRADGTFEVRFAIPHAREKEPGP